MVVAGPGTGKTELLGVRVANILQKTDELPGNILCLTFTESGATAMRERLAGLIGADAYKVAIHTFHSFGTEIINKYAEYFYHGAHFRPADELSSYELLYGLFEKLPHDNPLGSRMNNEFTYLRDAQSAISDLKKSGLTPDELLRIIDRNDQFCEWIQPKLQEALGDRLSKKSFSLISRVLEDLGAYTEDSVNLINYQPLHELTLNSLSRALEQSVEDDTTKPLSAWKREWCEKREDGELTLKDTKRSSKIRAVAGLYYDYLVAMQSRELYDFDDMILRVVHAIEVFDDLRYNLQEQYHYILVDEFQDTNDAQMRLVWNLTNSVVNEGRPNLLVVGDDDQAIYRFQGANISNILGFRELYRDVALITLKDNYRSSEPILAASREVIVQGSERLETSIPELDKRLTAHRPPVERTVSFTEYTTDLQEYASIARRLKARDTSKSHAVIARNHRQLRALLPYLQAEGLPLRYDAQDNILDNPMIRHLELLARITHHLAHNQHDEANALMPELLAHPAWGIDSMMLWKLSISAHDERSRWLDLMVERTDTLGDIASWLIAAGQSAHHQPLEYILDMLSGSIAEIIPDTEASGDELESGEKLHATKSFVSPFKAYYFSTKELDIDPSRYAQFLYALRTLRSHIREYRPDQVLTLHDFIEFIDLHHSLNLPINSTSTFGLRADAIELLTAHRSKGLEFDDVSVIALNDDVWGETARGRARLLKFPHNLPIDNGGDTTDEKLRLLYVALTRAKQTLHLTAHAALDTGKSTALVGYMVDSSVQANQVDAPSEARQLAAESTDWRGPLLAPSDGSRDVVLRPILERYKLSATHLNNFLDVTRGGPETFLLHNLLRFPQALSPHAAYGSAIHSTLQRAHQHLRATGKRRPIEDILGDFESSLRDCHLSDLDFDHFLSRGSDALNAFLAARYDSFTNEQIAERNFAGQGVSIGDALITGAIDLIEVNENDKTIVVTDYKTGRASRSWQGKTDIEKIKLHHYSQQLAFYKLLLENSREYHGYTVIKGRLEYVEPTPSGDVVRLDIDFDGDRETARLVSLIRAVWQRIMTLDFTTPDANTSLKDIIAFEDELLT